MLNGIRMQPFWWCWMSSIQIVTIYKHHILHGLFCWCWKLAIQIYMFLLFKHHIFVCIVVIYCSSMWRTQLINICLKRISLLWIRGKYMTFVVNCSPKIYFRRKYVVTGSKIVCFQESEFWWNAIFSQIIHDKASQSTEPSKGHASIHTRPCKHICISVKDIIERNAHI